MATTEAQSQKHSHESDVLLLEVIDFCRIFRQKLLLPKLTVESFGKAVCVKIASAFTMIETRVSDPHCIAQ